MKRCVWGTAFVLIMAGCSSGKTGGSSAPENTIEACQDESDNDGDGLVDCQDNECQVFKACPSDGADVGDRQDAMADTLILDDSSSPSDSTGAENTPVDQASPPDETHEDVGSPGGGQPCGYGSLKGRVCAPSQQVYVSGAVVTIETTDCAGLPITLTTTSNFDGVYLFESVPCGKQPVHIEKGSFIHEFEVQIQTDKLMDISGVDMKMCFGASSVSIAVFWGQWDEMHEIVERLGFDYDWYYYEDELYMDDPPWEDVEAVQLLRSPELLSQYNILILNCGSAYNKWVQEFPEIVGNVQDWVLSGGSLYSSDLAWIIGEKAFPNGIEFHGTDDEMGWPDGAQVIDGNQDFQAYIVDAELASYVGQLDLGVHYGPGPLISVTAAGEGTAVHVQAHIVQCTNFFDSCTTGVKLNEMQPVVLSFQPGPVAGRVVYSTFHVDEQEQQEKYDAILYYMMFML